MDEPRPCERQCTRCKIFKHHSRFRQYRDPKMRVEKQVRFSTLCRDCEQKERNERKNVDRPLSILRQRAARLAVKAGVSLESFWVQMNYPAFVEPLRTQFGPRGLCVSCGHKYLNETDVQIDHIEPPQHDQDWARLHARNLRIVCGSCNRTKGKKPFAVWLKEQEGARLSNLAEPTSALPTSPQQFTMF